MSVQRHIGYLCSYLLASACFLAWHVFEESLYSTLIGAMPRLSLKYVDGIVSFWKNDKVT